MDRKCGFSEGDMVVYPSHGVGLLKNIEKENIAGCKLKMLIINFQRNNMTLRLPADKAQATGLRAISSQQTINEILCQLKERIRPTKGIWARRAQEYETKINSGQLSSLSEVLRELHHKHGKTEQSYSERQIYQNALGRLAAEVSVVKSIDFEDACDELSKALKIA